MLRIKFSTKGNSLWQPCYDGPFAQMSISKYDIKCFCSFLYKRQMFSWQLCKMTFWCGFYHCIMFCHVLSYLTPAMNRHKTSESGNIMEVSLATCWIMQMNLVHNSLVRENRVKKLRIMLNMEEIWSPCQQWVLPVCKLYFSQHAQRTHGTDWRCY